MKSWIVLFICLVMTGCGPIYQTRTEYVPPSTPEGKLALNDCLHHRQECQTDCDNIGVQCEQNEAIKHIANKVADALTKTPEAQDKKHHQGANRCDNKIQTCKQGCGQTYNACYQNVGGVINTYQVCVYNCDKIPSQAVKVGV